MRDGFWHQFESLAMTWTLVPCLDVGLQKEGGINPKTQNPKPLQYTWVCGQELLLKIEVPDLVRGDWGLGVRALNPSKP